MSLSLCHVAISRITILALITVFGFTTYSQQAKTDPAAYNQKLQSSALLFMENKGQVADAKGNLSPDILFTANSARAKLYLSANTIHYQFTKTEYPEGYDPHKRELAKDLVKEAELRKQIKTSTHRFSLELQDANQHPIVSTEKQCACTENYYLSQCPNGITGVTGVHSYEKITYRNVYPNIDWVIYSKGGFMEYDFLVHPGGNPANIKLKVKDAESVDINSSGELVMKTSLGEVREKPPVSYVDGVIIKSHFKQLSDSIIGFDVQPQPRKELRIDPSVVWATYYGGYNLDNGNSCATDGFGNVYLSGYTESNTGIASSGYESTRVNYTDAFIVKFNNNGIRIWGTYFGGNSDDASLSIAAYGNNLYIAGYTYSSSGIGFLGFQNTYGDGPSLSTGGDAFVAKFNVFGTRLWSSYYGSNSSDLGYFCNVDASENVYLGGLTLSTTNISSNGFQMIHGDGGDIHHSDAFLVKFNSAGNRLWATYYGGVDTDYFNFCVVDSSGNIYASGFTNSETAIASGGFQNNIGNPGNPDAGDAFVVKFNSSGNRVWATYYGGAGYDLSHSGVIDHNNNFYLCGITTSTANIASGGFQNTGGGNNYDGFLVKFSKNGSRIWATYYGNNSGTDDFQSCKVDVNNNIYVIGKSYSTGVAAGGFQNVRGGNNDALIVKFNSIGGRIWATYYGGASDDYGYSGVLDNSGNLFMVGYTKSSGGIASGGFQNYYSGSHDAFVAKIDVTKTINSVCHNGAVALTSPLTGTAYQWQVNMGSGFTNLVNGVNYTGSNSITLQMSNLLSSFYGYQYRCLVNSNYTDIFQLRFANSWTGTTNSNWGNPANWSCGNLPDGNTDVVINTGPVTLNSNGICRTPTVKPGVSFTIATGNTLTITH
jgi:hypothetical protein